MINKILAYFASLLGKILIKDLFNWIQKQFNDAKRAKEEKAALDEYNKSVAEKVAIEKRVKDAENLLNSGTN